jgi:CBS domain-containing protein
MKVFETMTPGVVTVDPETTLAEAAGLMVDHGTLSLPVCESGRLVGVVSERDITIRSAAHELDARSARVREVMTPEVVCCFQNDDVGQAAGIMRKRNLRKLPVIDRAGRFVGTVSFGDIAPSGQGRTSPQRGESREEWVAR